MINNVYKYIQAIDIYVQTGIYHSIIPDSCHRKFKEPLNLSKTLNSEPHQQPGFATARLQARPMKL